MVVVSGLLRLHQTECSYNNLDNSKTRERTVCQVALTIKRFSKDFLDIPIPRDFDKLLIDSFIMRFKEYKDPVSLRFVANLFLPRVMTMANLWCRAAAGWLIHSLHPRSNLYLPPLAKRKARVVAKRRRINPEKRERASE